MINQFLDQIIHGDSLDVLKKIPDESVDLIFADPPYNLQLTSNHLTRPDHSNLNPVDDDWDKFMSFDDYDQFSKAWLKECRRILKPHGSIWVIGSYHNIYRMGKMIQDLDFWIINDILWIKTNPMPNFRGTRFNNAHETLIFASKSKESQYTFHYQQMKCYNDDKQMRSDWYIPLCNGLERLKIDGKKVHSTQKPEGLLYRVILSTSNVGDVILDPFSGSGTTAVVAKKLNRHYIGIEKNSLYVEASLQRLEQTQPYEKIRVLGLDKPKLKVSIGKLIEVGYLSVGQILTDEHRQYQAILNADGSITYNEHIGSIHHIASLLQHDNSKNGWEFWHIDYSNQLVNIDVLRLAYLDEYQSF